MIKDTANKQALEINHRNAPSMGYGPSDTPDLV